MVAVMAVQIQRWQFTVDDYARMLETGILSEAIAPESSDCS
jgi:hypothetical protein